ncbi:hypothetical protein K491DRAFT_682552 [Lophiostoma macrostomum CBS 122681]|uniref:EthD domain-containing protein n=1 Tax=Lophiostoma macrostomum CBS 122681 TaxID=1314788 RepID=A0A6A6SVJ4_9PLEO|nr:hypothetical protein K491DRAFT_682552 [Lophiostoma macrostomum CBS 122681]
MFLANITTLMMATAQITNPNLTDTDFNSWYNTALLPLFMTNHNASLGVRYKLIPQPTTPKPPEWQYMALYKTHENTTASPSIEDILPRALNERDIGPNDVAIEISSWTHIQTFESLREKRGEVPAGRPKIANVVRIEPREGGDAELDEWYRKQHLDMLSMLPNYRRTTRYQSADGSKPRSLAVHEWDTTDMDPYVGEVLNNTELTKSVMNGILTFDSWRWDRIFEKGNLTEKL